MEYRRVISVVEYHVLGRADAVLHWSTSFYGLADKYGTTCQYKNCQNRKPVFFPAWESQEVKDFVKYNNPNVIEVEDWQDYLDNIVEYHATNNVKLVPCR